MKLKNMILISLTGAAFLTGCGQGNTESGNEESSSLITETSSEASESSSTDKEEATILYKGNVSENIEMDEQRLYVSDLQPVEQKDVPGFDEVILLLNEDIPVTDKETGEPVKPGEIQEGEEVEVVLQENAPTTMSIPPQIPGNAIKKIEVIR